MPSMRNVELTAPYMHSGGMATLEQVVEFYNRGGDYAQQNRDDVRDFMQPLGLTDDEKAASLNPPRTKCCRPARPP